MTDIDPAAVMAAHAGSAEDDERWCDECCCHFGDEPCEPYRLAEALAEQGQVLRGMTNARDIWRANCWWGRRKMRSQRRALVAEQAKVARVEALANRWNRWPTLLGLVAELRAALADSPEPRVASPRA